MISPGTTRGDNNIVPRFGEIFAPREAKIMTKHKVQN